MQNVDEVLPLSPTQESMLLTSLRERGTYSEQIGGVLDARTDVGVFRSAWRTVIERHAALRTAFLWNGLERPLQVVRTRCEMPVAEIDWRGLSPAERSARLAAFLDSDRAAGFDLSRAPLMRVTLMRLDDGWQVVWTHHHLLLDAVSVALVYADLAACYEAARAGRAPEPPANRPYSDYLAWLRAQRLEEAESYWTRACAGRPGATLPTLAHRGGEGGPLYGEVQRRLDADFAGRLAAAARSLHVTLNTLLVAMWARVLSLYAGDPIVTFGMVVSGRPAELPGADAMVGSFVTTLPLRVEVRDAAIAGEWLQRVHAQTAEARRYEHVAYAQVQQWLARHAPLFDTMLSHEVAPPGRDAPSGLMRDVVRYPSTTGYPLTLVAQSSSDDLVLRLAFRQDRCDDAAALRLLDRCRLALAGFVERPDARLSDAALMDPSEVALIRAHGAASSATAVPALRIDEMFAAQAARAPEAVAVTFGSEQVTYGELARRAHALARTIAALGLPPEFTAGLFLRPSVDLIVAMLAVLEAGGAYVPIDPSYPAHRIAFIAEDAGLALMLCAAGAADLPPVPADVVRMRVDHAAPATAPLLARACGDLAYVIYTSGSTGMPKGALISHRNVTRLFDRTRQWFDFGPTDVWSLFHSSAFDFSVWEIWGALLYGGRLVIVDPAVRRSAPLFADLLRREQVTVLNQTPSAFGQLAQADAGAPSRLDALRVVVFGGEALDAGSLRPWLARYGDCRPVLVNMYGITETTVHVTYRPVTWRDVERDGERPIGRPIPDLAVHVLDRGMAPVPFGVPGELFVGGAGVARGYLGRPGLTAARFVPDPFSSAPGARLYRTGDRGMLLPDGELLYLGRIDDQVKIRGFRVEPAEVECVLRQHPGVRQAAVVCRAARDGAAGPRLVAYVVPASDRAPDLASLREYVAERVPEYMVPSAIATLDTLPLTAHGKLDRDALPEGDAVRTACSAPYVAPRNDVERRLAAIWSEVLGVADIGVHDDLFELGGHSLLILQLVSRTCEAFDVELPVREVFACRTIDGVAAALSRSIASQSHPGGVEVPGGQAVA